MNGRAIHRLQNFLGKVYYKMACLGSSRAQIGRNAKGNIFDDVYEGSYFSILNLNSGDLFGDYVTGSKGGYFQIIEFYNFFVLL